MTKISSRSREVAERIRDRQPFKTHGALSAEAVKGMNVYDSGQLQGSDLDVFREQAREIEFVVWSYWTPIAWWSKEFGWHRVAQRFSMTTSHHQGKLYLIEE